MAVQHGGGIGKVFSPDGLQGLSDLSRGHLLGGMSGTVPGASSVPGSRDGLATGALSSPDAWLRSITALQDENRRLKERLEQTKLGQTAEAVDAVTSKAAQMYAATVHEHETESAARRAEQKPRREKDLWEQIQSSEEQRIIEAECLTRRIDEATKQKQREAQRRSAAETRIASLREEADRLREAICQSKQECDQKLQTCRLVADIPTDKWVADQALRPLSKQDPLPSDILNETDWRRSASARRNHSALSWDMQRLALHS